jgi:hypothetical protein
VEVFVIVAVLLTDQKLDFRSLLKQYEPLPTALFHNAKGVHRYFLTKRSHETEVKQVLIYGQVVIGESRFLFFVFFGELIKLHLHVLFFFWRFFDLSHWSDITDLHDSVAHL